MHRLPQGFKTRDHQISRQALMSQLEEVGFFTSQQPLSWEGTDVDGKPANDDKTAKMNVVGSKMELVRSAFVQLLTRFDPIQMGLTNGTLMQCCPWP